MKLNLEAVMEDASEEVYSFQILRSLKYLKFVGVVKKNISSYYQNPSWRRIILRNPIVLNSYLGISSEAFFAIFNSGYIL